MKSTRVNERCISVIIPVFNAQNTVVSAVSCVFNQTARNHIKEVVVVDDGSTDDSIERIKAHWEMDGTREKSIHGICLRIIRKENGGVSSARNLGIRESSGEWIAFLDSDDIWRKDKIAKQIELIRDNPEIECIGTGSAYDNATPGEHIEDCLYRMGIRDLLYKWWPHIPSIIVKRSLLRRTGVFDESKKYAEDGDLFIRIAAITPIYYTSEELIECGHGKPSFGSSGLSLMIREMHIGSLMLVRDCYNNKYINWQEYYMYSMWETIRYYRRCWIVFFRRLIGASAHQ